MQTRKKIAAVTAAGACVLAGAAAGISQSSANSSSSASSSGKSSKAAPLAHGAGAPGMGWIYQASTGKIWVNHVDYFAW